MIPDYVQVVVARLIGEPKKDDRVFTRLSNNLWTDGITGGAYYEDELEEVRL